MFNLFASWTRSPEAASRQATPALYTAVCSPPGCQEPTIPQGKGEWMGTLPGLNCTQAMCAHVHIKLDRTAPN